MSNRVENIELVLQRPSVPQRRVPARVLVPTGAGAPRAAAPSAKPALAKALVNARSARHAAAPAAALKAALVYSRPAIGEGLHPLRLLLSRVGFDIGPRAFEIAPADIVTGAGGTTAADHHAARVGNARIAFLWTGDLAVDEALTRRLRARGKNLAIISLTPYDGLSGAGLLDAGIDDTWPEPREPAELVERARAAVKRANTTLKTRTRSLSNFTLDYGQRVGFAHRQDVDAAGKTRTISTAIRFPVLEFHLLDLLLTNGAAGVSHADFDSIEYAMRRRPSRGSRDVYLTLLRRKFAANGVDLEIVSTDGQAVLRRPRPRVTPAPPGLPDTAAQSAPVESRPPEGEPSAHAAPEPGR